MNIIEVKNLSYSYENDDKKILDDISFSIKKGEYVTFIGCNGSGKSTLMKILMGLIEDYQGEVIINNLKLNEKNLIDIRKHIGIVFQNPDNQFIGATVRDDIAFGLENMCVPQKEMDPIILDYAKKVGMEEYLDKEPSALSGGQKQRVAIADALSMNLDIILLDEATAMLDPQGREEIVSLTHKMMKENKELTIVNVTHHMDEAFLSDRIIVLNKGKIVLDGTPKEVFAKQDLLYSIGLDLPFELKLKNALKVNKLTHVLDEELK